MGSTGAFLMILLVLMAVTSTGSAEIIAVTSILIYDIYYFYLKPFRELSGSSDCILCGFQRGRYTKEADRCHCISMTNCDQCIKVNITQSENKEVIKPPYQCEMHGPYRAYSDYLLTLKNWSLLWITLAIIPLTVILYAVNISLGWVYLFMGILIGSAVIPICLSIYWKRLTGTGMVSGAIGGTTIAIIVWLSVASTKQGGLANFLQNTGDEVSMLSGNMAAILSGGVICILVSLFGTWGQKFSDSEVWECTRDIDSPLRAWTELYARDMNLVGADELDSRPPLEEVRYTFRWATLVANGGALFLSICLIIIWPAATAAVGVFSLNNFKHWLNISQSWGIIATVFIIIMPLVNEVLEIRGVIKKNNEMPAPNIKLDDINNTNNLLLHNNTLQHA